jgi:hypothetical protein
MNFSIYFLQICVEQCITLELAVGFWVRTLKLIGRISPDGLCA